jgi:hypothetical protein
MRSRILIVLRYSAILLAALLLALFAFIQVQQRLFRHRAQLLLNDIQALQLHPGTFADLERLQQHWGAFGRYDGTCTAQHCDYMIELDGDGVEPPRWLMNIGQSRWVERSCELLGGRGFGVLGSIVVHDDHMVLESFRVVLDVPPHKGPNEYEGESYDGEYALWADIRSASRLFLHGEMNETELKRGYEIGRPGACEGCMEGWVHFTEQTNPADIKRLGNINLDCLTRFSPCVDLDDLLPATWSEYRREHSQNSEWSYKTRCSLPPALFAREADNAILVEVLRLHLPEYPGGERTLGAKVRIIERLKNAVGKTPGSTADFDYAPESIYPIPGASKDGSRKLVIGSRVIVLYPQPFHGQSPDLIDPMFCSLIPLTDATLQSVREGIAMDPSGGDLHGHE